jgi:hypothetical protein
MTPPKKQPAPTTNVCGFHGSGGVVTETALRAAIAAAATTERGTWRPGGTFQRENDPARFGDLVRYWLGGTKGHEVIRPDTLLAAQQAALDPSVKYSVLLTSTLSTAVSTFVAADQAVDTAAAALLSRWDDVDVAQLAFDAARAKVAPAKTAVDAAVTARNNAEEAVTQAEAGVKAGTASQAVLDQAKIDLGAATTTLGKARAALTAAVALRDTKNTALRTAEKKRNDARNAFVKAKKDKDKVEPPAAALDTTLLKKVVDQLLAVPRPAGVPAIKRSFVNAAVEQAHKSRGEIAAWSAAFVTACVRGVAIAQKLEAMDGGDHKGQNVLLVATGRHSEYVIAARDQRKDGGLSRVRARPARRSDRRHHRHRPGHRDRGPHRPEGPRRIAGAPRRHRDCRQDRGWEASRRDHRRQRARHGAPPLLSAGRVRHAGRGAGAAVLGGEGQRGLRPVRHLA